MIYNVIIGCPGKSRATSAVKNTSKAAESFSRSLSGMACGDVAEDKRLEGSDGSHPSPTVILNREHMNSSGVQPAVIHNRQQREVHLRESVRQDEPKKKGK